MVSVLPPYKTIGDVIGKNKPFVLLLYLSLKQFLVILSWLCFSEQATFRPSKLSKPLIHVAGIAI